MNRYKIVALAFATLIGMACQAHRFEAENIRPSTPVYVKLAAELAPEHFRVADLGDWQRVATTKISATFDECLIVLIAKDQDVDDLNVWDRVNEKSAAVLSFKADPDKPTKTFYIRTEYTPATGVRLSARDVANNITRTELREAMLTEAPVPAPGSFKLSLRNPADIVYCKVWTDEKAKTGRFEDAPWVTLSKTKPEVIATFSDKILANITTKKDATMVDIGPLSGQGKYKFIRISYDKTNPKKTYFIEVWEDGGKIYLAPADIPNNVTSAELSATW